MILKNKKGALTDVIIWIIVAFVIAAFFGLWAYGHQLITDQLVNSGSELVANASKEVVQPANQAIQTSLDTLGIVILVGMIVSIFISNFLIKGNPVFFILYIIIATIGIIFSATVSNNYMNLIGNEVIGSTLAANQGITFIMQYLPYFATVIAVIGGLFIYLGIIREKNQGIGV